ATEPNSRTRNHGAKSRYRLVFSVKRPPGLANMLLIGLFVVQLLDPLGKIGTIKGTSDPVVGIRVIPIRGVRHVPGGKNRTAILNRNTDDFRIAALHLDFIGNRAHKQTMRRRTDRAGNTTNLRGFWIENAGHGLFNIAVVPFVADDAADRGRRSA